MKTLNDLQRKHIKAAASKDSLRPAMTGALLEPEDSELVVTNGHILVKYPVIVDEGDQRSILKQNAFPKSADLRNFTGNIAVGVDGSESIYIDHKEQFANIDADYPDHKRVWPTDDQEYIIGLSRSVVKDLMDSLPDDYNELTFEFTGPYSAIRVKAETLNSTDKPIWALLMPRRIV